MPELLAALDAFLQDHRRFGDLDGSVDGERVGMVCDCGAGVAHSIPPAGPAWRSRAAAAPFLERPG